MHIDHWLSNTICTIRRQLNSLKTSNHRFDILKYINCTISSYVTMINLYWKLSVPFSQRLKIRKLSEGPRLKTFHNKILLLLDEFPKLFVNVLIQYRRPTSSFIIPLPPVEYIHMLSISGYIVCILMKRKTRNAMRFNLCKWKD